MIICSRYDILITSGRCCVWEVRVRKLTVLDSCPTTCERRHRCSPSDKNVRIVKPLGNILSVKASALELSKRWSWFLPMSTQSTTTFSVSQGQCYARTISIEVKWANAILERLEIVPFNLNPVVENQRVFFPISLAPALPIPWLELKRGLISSRFLTRKSNMQSSPFTAICFRECCTGKLGINV